MKGLEMIEICHCELQLVTERIGSGKHPAETIASFEYGNVSEYPVVSPDLLKVRENHCLG